MVDRERYESVEGAAFRLVSFIFSSCVPVTQGRINTWSINSRKAKLPVSRATNRLGLSEVFHHITLISDGNGGARVD